MTHFYASVVAVCMLVFASPASYACTAKQLPGDLKAPMQKRATTAFVKKDNGTVFLSWRLFKSDSVETSFNVYRCKDDGPAVKVNSAPLTQATHTSDSPGCDSYDACRSYSWIVAAVVDKTIVGVTPPVKVSNQSGQSFTSVATGIGAFGRRFAFGDLTGDGELEYVLRYSAVTVDPYHRLWRPSDGTYKLVAFNKQKERLWLYDMGPSIERGIWYSPYLLYDLNQDGKAELIVKGGDDSLARKDMVDESGRVTKGPEYLKIINGADGQTVLASAPWPDRSGYIGDARPYSDYNRYSRQQMAIAYVDGQHPHVVIVRGTYGKQKVHLYRYTEKDQLSLVWRWENTDPRPFRADGDMENYKALEKWWGQGAHTIRVGDIDGDGKDEIIIGGVALDHDGTPLWSISRGDLDHIHLGDLNPDAPGLEVYYGAERGHEGGGMGMVSAATGKVLWSLSEQPTKHIHNQGLCADLYKSQPGVECYSGEADRSSYWTWSSDGEVLSKSNLGGLAPKAAYWDGGAHKSLIRLHSDTNELLYADIVDLESGEVIDQIQRPVTMDKKDRPHYRILAIADILGDWREEIIAVDRGNLVIYMSTKATEHRQPWLMSDHTYKMGAILASMGYYHQPLLGYDLNAALGITRVKPNKADGKTKIIKRDVDVVKNE